MSNAYYDDVFDPNQPARSAGWRHELEQAFRFELARACFPPCARPRVLDMGCGPGGFPAYIKHSYPQSRWDYTGMDLYAPSIEAARARCPDESFVVGDLVEAAQASYDVVVGIGSLVDGHSRDHRARLRHLLSHTRAMLRASAHRACFILLKSEAMSSSVALSSEPALAGASQHELEELMRHINTQDDVFWRVLDAGRQDWVLVVDKRAAIDARDGMVERACARVIESPWGARAPGWRCAWLYWAVGLEDKARGLMSCVESNDAGAAVLRARLG